MASIEDLIWKGIAPHQIIHLSDDEKPLLDDASVLAQLRYLGLEPLKVHGTIHEALATIARGQFTTPVGTVQQVGVEPSLYADSAHGCFEFLKALGQAQPRAVLLILPSEKADTAFLDLIRTGQARGRVLVVS